MIGLFMVLLGAPFLYFCLTYDDFIRPYRHRRQILREVKSGKIMSGPGTVQSILVRRLPDREWMRLVSPKAPYYNGRTREFCYGKPTTEKLKDMISILEECPPHDMVIFEHDNNTREVVSSQCGFTGLITEEQYVWLMLGGSLGTSIQHSQ